MIIFLYEKNNKIVHKYIYIYIYIYIYYIKQIVLNFFGVLLVITTSPFH